MISIDDILDNRLGSKASAFDLQELERRVATLEQRVSKIAEAPSYHKEAYTLQELSDEIGISPVTIRKNYIAENRIKAFMPKDSNRYFVRAEEFERVVHVQRTTGGLYSL